MRGRCGAGKFAGEFIESLEIRRLLAVFAQDFSYDPPGPFPYQSNYFLERVSGGRFLSASAEEQPGDGSDRGPINTVIRRLLANGSIDTAFGKKGEIRLGDYPAVFTGARIYAIVEDATGRELQAYTVNGKPDATFGGGDGNAPVPIEPIAQAGIVESSIIHTYSNNRVLTLTRFLVTDGGGKSHYEYELVRQASNGSLDTNFGNQGRLHIEAKLGLEVFLTDTALYLHSDAVTAGTGELTRYDSAGKAIDSTFGTGGKVTIPRRATQFIEQTDGKLLFIETSTSDPVIRRLNADGTPDSGFGASGKIVLTNADSASFGAPGGGRALLLDDQGRITAAAVNTIFRFNSGGVLDSAPFNGTVPFQAGELSYDAQGRVLVGGEFGIRYAQVSPTQISPDGIVHVVGTNHNDTINIAPASGGKVRFSVNGAVTDIALAKIVGIDVDLYAGNNKLTLSANLPVTVDSGAGDDSIVSANGNDDIEAGSGNDTIQMGNGNDTLSVGKSDNTNDAAQVTGGTGNKRVSISGGSATVNLGVGNHEINASAHSKNSNIAIAGGSSMLRLVSTGNIVTIGGNGNNTVQCTKAGDNDITTGDGNDTITMFAANATVRGGGGNDKITVSLVAGTNHASIFAAAGNDLVNIGDDSPATVFGGDGADTLNGGSLDQSLYGEGGKDSLSAGDGNDYMSGGGANDRIDGEAGNDTAFGGLGDDIIDGGDGNDYLAGQDNRDKIYGGAGDDRLYGGASGDWIYTQNGNDRVYGDGGDDRIYADYPKGRQTLYGGAGNDLFVTADQLSDLVNGEGGVDKAQSDQKDVLVSIEGKA